MESCMKKVELKNKTMEEKINKEVVIYGTPTCHYCQVAKQYFRDKKIGYRYIDVKEDLEQRKKMIELSGQMGVPVITVGDRVMKGWDEDIFDEMIS